MLKEITDAAGSIIYIGLAAMVFFVVTKIIATKVNLGPVGNIIATA